MAEVSSVVASAVILPELEASQPVPASPSSKRRQSSASDSTSKRPRLSKDGSADSPPRLHGSPQPIDDPRDTDAPSERRRDSIQDRRKSSMQEEKKRGQRLFGGLLSTLSQSTPNGQQKRRAEVEKRQQEKAKQQKAADETRRKERLANLQTVRRTEQVKFDEQSMRIRHSNLLAFAHFLCTKSEPKIYYKPWELLPSDEERIKDQIAEAKAAIEREEADFRAKHPKDISREPVTQDEKEETIATSKETVGEPQAESLSVSNDVDTTNSHVQVPQPDPITAENQAQEEHSGEVVVENDEDTVIY